MKLACFTILVSLAVTGCCALDLLFPAENPAEAGLPGASDGAGRPVFASSGAVSIRLVSRSEVAADLTLQFLVGETAADPVQIRLAAFTQAEVIAPDAVTEIEIGGAYATGESVPLTLFRAGVDFAPGIPAVYFLLGPDASANIPPTISVVEPAADVSLPAGGALYLAWTFENPDDVSFVVGYLDGNDINLDGNEIRLTPVISEQPSLSGRDEVLIGVPLDTAPGTYHVLLTISDGMAQAAARSRGTVTIFAGRPGGLPELTILAPESDTSVTLGGSLGVRWSDNDDEYSASIRFFLVAAGAVFPGLNASPLGGVFSEDLDGTGDEASLTVSGVSAGTYDLWGMMDNGSDVVTARAPGRLLVTPAPAAGGGSCVSPPSIGSIDPPLGARNATVQVTIYGTNFVAGASGVRLSRADQAAIVAAQVQVAPNGESLTCDLDLYAAASGGWDVVVSTPNCPEATLVGAFVVTPSADFDGDGDADSEDFTLFNLCENGPNTPPAPIVANCDWADLDLDNDVDQADFLAFQRCFNGPNRPPKCQ